MVTHGEQAPRRLPQQRDPALRAARREHALLRPARTRLPRPASESRTSSTPPTAKAYRLEVDPASPVAFKNYPPVINPRAQAEHVARVAEAAFRPERVTSARLPWFASEDFSYYLACCRGRALSSSSAPTPTPTPTLERARRPCATAATSTPARVHPRRHPVVGQAGPRSSPG